MSLSHIYSGDVQERAVSTGSLDARLAVNARYQSIDFQAWLMQRLDVRQGERVLDVGCGTGAQSLRFLSDIGPSGTVSAVDIAADSVAALTAASSDDPRLQAVTADMAELDRLLSEVFTTTRFTLAHSAYALYYSPAREDVLRTMVSALAPGGRVAVFTPIGPHGMVDLAARFGAVPDAVYDSLEFGLAGLTPLLRELCWDVRADYFQSVMRVTSVDDFMAFYRATTYYDPAAEEALEAHARAEIAASGAVSYAKNGYLVQGSGPR